MRGIVGLLHYVGLYLQLNAALTIEHGELDNYLHGNALFTEVPHDVTTKSGKDVEMACSFRGAGSPSSLEIQWWYNKEHRDWPKKPAHITNDVVPQQEPLKDATKISVVKVAGSNISHKLRLSSVKPSDEGTYECRVIDFSGSVVQRHHVWAYLHVESNQSTDVHGSGRQSDQINNQHRSENDEKRMRSHPS
ncbi:V-set and transmembrane domain-containing protein 2-like protein [Corythoichthys intestinalis]|uniref:V-set and transmembrane domain-containing protein 2-like protein n=1 Tax=Corythoichthys intestinalis TaxID=161448 RepID=UPI0025A6103A|nr:V-set and transmembrane domain-containing protein 2-like protein [Corythoichthys intestinalis]XP_061814205.1 V-set and transmembrane domain-containing protein 2-like protein [Nerophis lumbriciformis]